MDGSSQVSRALHDEHRASLDLLGRVERVLGAPRAAGDELAPAARTLLKYLQQEVDRHFGFEERELFSRMSEAGESDLAALLAEEHESISAVAEDLQPLLQSAAAGQPFDAAALQRLMPELIERQVAHIQKETMALLPLLDDLLDEDTDRDLAFAYASSP